MRVKISDTQLSILVGVVCDAIKTAERDRAVELLVLLDACSVSCVHREGDGRKMPGDFSLERKMIAEVNEWWKQQDMPVMRTGVRRT